MNALEFIKQDVIIADRILGQTMDGLTNETFHWQPPGTANRISDLYFHVVTSQDSRIHKSFQDKPTLWESGWHSKMGLGPEPKWEAFAQGSCELETALQYGAAAQEALLDYLSSIQPDGLDKPLGFQIMGQDMTVGSMLILMMLHKGGHGGEIACLKGIQGLKGLPI